MSVAATYAPNRYHRVQMNTVSLNNAHTKALVGASLKGYSLHCIIFRTATDPACGSGSLLIRALAEVPFEISGYGQEKESSTAGLAKMNAVLHNKATIKIMAGNTFSDPQFIKNEDASELERFDYIVANPPFSLKNWSDGLKEFGRFSGYGDRPPEKNGDYAWLMHILKTLKSTGKAAVILPHGVLFRGNAEGTIRLSLIKAGSKALSVCRLICFTVREYPLVLL